MSPVDQSAVNAAAALYLLADLGLLVPPAPRPFMPCMPDRMRAKGFHQGGCQHPVWCAARGECYYGRTPGGDQ